MKFSLIAAIVVLALAQGSFAQQDASMDMEKIQKYFEDMKTKITTDLSEFFRNQDLATQAQSVAAQVKEQITNAAAGFETHLQPMATNVQEQMRPMLENFQRQMEAAFEDISTKAKAIAN